MQIRLGPLPTVILFNLFAFVHAANFTFQYGDASSCSPFQVSWSGGSPPFQLTLIPVFGTPRSVNIPASSFTNGKGSFSTQMPFPQNQTFLVSMSDASGFASGGTSEVATVGPALSGNSCNTTDPGVNFFFELNTALNQCRPYTFSGYDTAVQPITITGIIPGGSTFVLNPPVGPTSFDWIANTKAGTSILWMLTDSQGRTGGSSDVKLVGVSDDNTCLSNNSPASVASFPSHTAPPSPTKSAAAGDGSSTSPTATPAAGPNVGLIAGVAIAGVFALIAIVILVWFFRRRNRRDGRYGQRVDLMDPQPGSVDDHTAPPINPYPYAMSTHGHSQAGSVAYGVHPTTASSHHLLSDHGSEAGSAFPLTSPYSAYGGTSTFTESAPRQSYHDEPSYYSSTSGSSAPPPPGPSSPSSGRTAGRSKAALAGAQPYKPARFIVHTDLEEATPEDEGEEVIELPPQYSEARAPIPGLAPPPSAVPQIALTPATPASPRPPQDLLR